MSSTFHDLCDATVEVFLDEHPGFTERYFSTRDSADFLQSWLNPRHRSGSLITSNIKNEMNSGSPTSKQAPVKDCRVSRQTRKQESVTNREKFDDVLDKNGEERKNSTQGRSQLEDPNEKELLMELIRDISNELDVQRLSHKILVNVGALTKADRCSLFLAQGPKEDRILVSKLFDVTSDSTLEESLRGSDDEITVPFGVGIAGHTAQTGETININNAYQDRRFNSAIDKQTGYTTHSIVCMPIKNYDDQVIGVAQVINKKSDNYEFTEKDVEVVKKYLTFCGIGITNARLFELSVMESKRNQVLLQLAKRIFEEQTSIEKVVHNIMIESQELLHCERCSVLLVDTSVENDIVFSKSFDLLPEGQKEESSSTNANWSLKNGIASFTAVTGETINIPDAYADSRVREKVEQADAVTGFKTKSILCTPIKREQKIIGVCQLINRIDGRPFDENDQSLFEAFAIFCGIGIHNTNMYEQTSKLLAKQMVAMEVLSYHARAALEDVDRLMQVPVPESDKFNLHDFAFNDFDLSDDETIQASLRMFLDLDILNAFHVSSKTFFSWLLSVKKNYRPVIYHNWRHALNVAQTMFAMLTTGNMRRNFTDLETFALLVACFCHDLDHRGTNNTFQSKIESPLAQLYGTSTMEHHHFDHSIMILNSEVMEVWRKAYCLPGAVRGQYAFFQIDRPRSFVARSVRKRTDRANEGNNIFSELPPDDYRKTIGYLEHAILSTDLQIYFKKRNQFSDIIHGSQSPNWDKNCDNRDILRAMMMTACDVAAITKPWPVQQAVAKLVASEFFQQGDIERDQLKSEPLPMMDRKRKDDLPKMQVGFIDSIGLPIYELMQKVEQNLSPLYDGVVGNRKNWQTLAEEENNDSADLPVRAERKDSVNSSNNHPASQLDERNNNFTENEVTREEKMNSAPISKKNNSTPRSFSKTCCLV